MKIVSRLLVALAVATFIITLVFVHIAILTSSVSVHKDAESLAWLYGMLTVCLGFAAFILITETNS